MHNIAEYTVFVFPAGHCHEQPFVPLYDLDVVHGEHVVYGDRNNCPKPSFGNDSSDFNICDFHVMTSSTYCGAPFCHLENGPC